MKLLNVTVGIQTKKALSINGTKKNRKKDNTYSQKKHR